MLSTTFDQLAGSKGRTYMNKELPDETYGFRFNSSDQLHLPICHLFAVGHDHVTDNNYRWHGLERSDGPLLLFQYTISGQGVLELNGEKLTVAASHAFLVEIPSNHCYYYASEQEQQDWQFIFLQVRPHTIMPLWNEITELIGRLPKIPPESAPIEKLKQLFLAAQQGHITDPYTASSYVYSFFMALRQFADSNPVPSTMPTAIANAVQWINANYANMIGQEQLAELVGLSKYHFLRSFSRYVGLTPNDYVNRKRIEKSLELLLSTDHSLEQIANAVGFSSASYYIRMFRKLVGQTPATFRSNKHQLSYNRLFFD